MKTPVWTRVLLLGCCLGGLVLGGCGDAGEQAVTGSPDELLASLKRGDGLAAMRLLEAGVLAGRGASSEAADAGGGSVLYHAVRTGELAAVKALLDRGANPNQDIPGGGALVAYALENGRTASAQLLFRSGAIRRARGADGSPVSFLAARRGADWMLREILEQGAEVDARDARGETLVHVAVRIGRSDMLPLLWGHGADTDAMNRAGETPLHVALGLGRPEMVAALLKHGASAGLPDREGRLPVALAMDRGEFAEAQMLADDGGANLEGFLRAAVAAGDDARFDFLMANGVDPNVSRDDPPLLEAVRRGDERMAQVLLEAGADPTVVGREGQSVFHLAMARDLPATVTLLLDRGAGVNEAFKYPVSEEFQALVKSEGAIKWFLKNDRRVTPLMMAADRGNAVLARVLLERGAKTNVWTAKHRHWPINFASRRADVKLMQLLLKRDPNRKGRSVKVDLSKQRAWVYAADGTVLLETAVSSGKKNYRTRTGEFVITNKYRRWKSTVYHGASMPYFQRLSCGDFGFHEGSCPGYAASHGCIRVPRGKASKLYALTRAGDRVTIVE